MFRKKINIVMVIFLAISGSILTWFLFYDGFSHHSPVRAKQVFNSVNKVDSSFSGSEIFSKYNDINNVQTILEVRSFN